MRGERNDGGRGRRLRRTVPSGVAAAALVAGLIGMPLAGTSSAAGLDTTMYGVASTTLFTFNPATGVQTALPTPTSFATAALARQPGSTRLYYYATTANSGAYSAAYYDLADNTNHVLPNTINVYLPRLAFKPDGTLVGMAAPNTLYTLSPTTGAVLSTTTISGLSANGGDIAFDASGTMWVVAQSVVYKVPAGTTAVSSQIALPDGNPHAGAAFGPNGHLFVTDTQTPSVLYNVDVDAGTVTTVGAGGSASVTDLASETNRPPTSGPAVATSTAYATPVGINGLSGASDPDGDPLTVAGIATPPAHGTATVSGSTVTYTPAAGFAGTDTVTWRISDGLGGTTTNTATISVVKPPPAFTGAAGNSAQTVQPGGTPAAVAAANPTGGSETYTLDSGSLPPGVTLQPDGSFQGTVGAPGVWTATIRTTDAGGTSTTTLTITVPNLAPAFTSAPTNSSQTLVLHDAAPAAMAAADANGDTFTYGVTGGTLPAGITLNTDGTFAGSATATGTSTATITVTDSHGASTSHPLTLTVQNAPAPTAPDRTATTPAETATTLNLLSGTTDPSGYPLSLSAVGTPTSGTVTRTGGSVTYTPDAAFSGDDSFSYTVDNGHGGVTTKTVSVVVTPTVDPISTTTPAGTATTIDLRASAHGGIAPAAASTVVIASPAHGTTSVQADGSVRYTPIAGWSGSDSFSFRLTDTSGRATPVTNVGIAVTPVTVDDAADGPAGSPIDVDVLANDTATVQPGAVTLVTDGVAGSVAIDPSGIARYTPAAGWSGNDSFTYRVTDASGQQSRVTTASITVTPTAGADTAAVDAGGSVPVAVLANDEGDFDPSTVTVAGPAHGSTTLNVTTGVLTYTPAPGWSGPDSFTYRVKDHANQQTPATAVSLGVRPVAVDDAASVAAGGTTTVPVTGNDSGALAPSSVTVTTAPAHGTATSNGTGGVTYVPAAGWSGPDSFTYSVSDGTTTVTATVDLDVTPVAHADAATTAAGSPVTFPLLGNDLGRLDGTSVVASTPAHGTVTVDGSGLATYTPTAGWSGPDSFTYTVVDASGQLSNAAPVSLSVTPLGTAKTLTVAAGSSAPLDSVAGLTGHFTGSVPTLAGAPAHGTVTFSGTTAIYAADAHWSGPDAFSYTVPDGAGHLATGTVAVTVTPVAVADTATTDADTPTAVSVLDNDSGAPIAGTVAVTATPAHGTATVTGGIITYTPTAGWSGPDSLTYSVQDAAGQTSSATVGIVVRPVAVDDAASTQGEAVAVPVLANDSGTLDPTTVTVVGAPAHGTTSVAPDGTVGYQPASGWTGTDAFTYTVTDAAGRTAGPATVTVTVLAAPVTPAPSAPAPTPAAPKPTLGAVPDHQDVKPGGSATFDVFALNGIADRTGWRVLLAGKPAHGTVSIVDGTLVYTAEAGFSGNDQLRYTLVAPDGRKATATLTVSVAPKAAPAGVLHELPFTGLPLAGLLSAAAALLGGGIGLRVLGRRRREA